ncbi:GSCFA domain-containing protein [Tropicimonas sediminicola]|uniref:GSCFA family protein n=1 Tax=Tropicimonas sediminicola TaxID=1031541 RepID=A0A239C5H7_9RHOB|nr:GSCFA domain-containing protein [Tropicimonas sediminicola]SNS15525.1 GSCFA family protein [Tropicimonas sediminicola]
MTKTDHPYRSQPPKAFWKRTVSGVHPLDVEGWYSKKFSIDKMRVATAGSCFAQHIGRNLRARGFSVVDTEPAPEALSADRHLDYGYGMYSARYGNVYTSRQLLQLFQRALGQWKPAEPAWVKGDGVVDPFRPTIEPEPFGSVAEMEALRASHLECVAEILRKSDLFIFTMGLTETWLSKEDGAAFPLCPGTAGGTFSEDRHVFHNLSPGEIHRDMQEFIKLVRSVNPKMRFILTVSPVPLMATATNDNVAVATMYSKSALRAAAGRLAGGMKFVDYFPSYEIISSPFMRGQFFNPDMREVSAHGVNHVMDIFFAEHAPLSARNAARTAGAGTPGEPEASGKASGEPMSEEERLERILCDEELLAEFGEAKK